MKNVISNGNNPATATIPPAHNICQMKLVKIANNRWPAVIFAANRKPKDTGFAKYEINSTATKKGAIPGWTPGGKNIAS